jgi:hypothetical protein
VLAAPAVLSATTRKLTNSAPIDAVSSRAFRPQLRRLQALDMCTVGILPVAAVEWLL